MPSGASQFQIENEISDFQSTSASPFTETDSVLVGVISIGAFAGVEEKKIVWLMME